MNPIFDPKFYLRSKEDLLKLLSLRMYSPLPGNLEPGSYFPHPPNRRYNDLRKIIQESIGGMQNLESDDF